MRLLDLFLVGNFEQLKFENQKNIEPIPVREIFLEYARYNELSVYWSIPNDSTCSYAFDVCYFISNQPQCTATAPRVHQLNLYFPIGTTP